MKSEAIYINRGGLGFERYAGTRETLAIVGWPSIFPERWSSDHPASVSPALKFLRTNELKELHLLSMDEPDDATWEALGVHVAAEPR